ncbi:LipA and NB-ARC domain-containing protein [Phlyctema vagabunda]|uniref:LipA and NB-ARC domain-containing protein n=1 Tax=Phlyctema vagabunda TaxID=108571 RepID=A0ABR4PSU7_9HELO
MGTAINLDEIKRYEVTEVYAHPDAKVDIILVHGLNGNPRKTWTAKNGVFWPTQLLPVSLKSAKARILVYGYNADVYTFGSSKSASSDMIHQHAQTLVSNIALERKSEEVSDHPIIWVAHSLGGILLKRALELSNDLTSKNADDNRNIFVSTYGIIFLGTPHTGADPAKWGLILQGMLDTLVPKKVMDTEPHLVKTLKTNNETLQNINLHFLDIYQRFKICMAHEAHKTDMKGTQSFIVDQESASPLLPDVQYFGIEATHSGMCKFESKNSPGYLNVATTIKGWVQESPRVIDARIEMEKRTRQQIVEAQAREMLGIYESVAFQTPQGSNPHTPGTSMSGFSRVYQENRPPSLISAPQPRSRFEFEAAEVEEMDTDMAERR